LPIFTGCDWDESKPEPYIRYLVDKEDGMKIPEFHTNLTNEEHLKNIQELAEKRYRWASRIYVDLLYNYKDEPQFFLVEYEYSAIVGIIIEDKYYIMINQPEGYEKYESGNIDNKEYRFYNNSPLEDISAYENKKYLCYNLIFFEEDGTYYNYTGNKKYHVYYEGLDEQIITSYDKKVAFEKFEDWHTNYVIWATAKENLKEVEYKGTTYNLYYRLRYGYAETVNDLIKL
jgi:hypothetical protein